MGRSNPKYISRLVTRNLINQLRIGLDANKQGAFELQLCNGLRAVLVPDNVWVVRTFIATVAPDKLHLPG